MAKNRPGRQRLSIDVPTDIHDLIIKYAQKRNITITLWVLRALQKEITDELKYD